MNKNEIYVEMDEAKTIAIHKAKAKSSFKTKMNFFLYRLAKVGKSEIDAKAFSKFNLEEESELIKEYTTVYVQEETNYVISNFTVEEIYSKLSKLKKQIIVRELERDYVSKFESVFPLKAFTKNIKKEACCYCEITTSEITELIDLRKINKKASRGFNLEVERFDANLEYTVDNCDMACYWCNNAKTDEFTKKEFMKIGKAFRKVWDSRK
jgi:5-methylcytosine-specific restriction endonuclease McrA